MAIRGRTYIQKPIVRPFSQTVLYLPQIATGKSYSVGTPTSTAKKVAVVTARCCAVAVGTSTAKKVAVDVARSESVASPYLTSVVIRQVTANCAAVGIATGATMKVSTAAGTCDAVAASDALVVKVVTPTGTSFTVATPGFQEPPHAVTADCSIAASSYSTPFMIGEFTIGPPTARWRIRQPK